MRRPARSQPPVAEGLTGAFAPLRTLDAMPAAARRGCFARVAEAGLSFFLTEGSSPPQWLAPEVAAAGLRLGGGLACFSDHASSAGPVLEHLRPIARDGNPRLQMEWYRGIIPTDRAYEDDLVATCRSTAADPSLQLFALDFIRWPLHWELELRNGANPIESSFDPITLRRFRDEAGVDIPVDEPRTAAARILADHEGDWVAFKCRVITATVERIVGEIRAARPGLLIGAFIVPGTDDERRRHAGQDVIAIGAQVDVLLPMTYHAILGRQPRWVGEVVTDIRQRTAAPVVPVVQATADPALAGLSDWGAPFEVAELGEAIDAGLAAGGSGFVVFPAHGLDAERVAAVRSRSRQPTSAPATPRP